VSAPGRAVSRGFILRCDINSKQGINLEVNWAGGNKFHLTKLTSALCTDNPSINPAPPKSTTWDTFKGTGEGLYNGAAGATIEFTFEDWGEPGTSDTASMTIKSGSIVVLTSSGRMLGGNNQAHG
jgi:hypothetical protein